MLPSPSANVLAQKKHIFLFFEGIERVKQRI